jgi:hypothetical protein
MSTRAKQTHIHSHTSVSDWATRLIAWTILLCLSRQGHAQKDPPTSAPTVEFVIKGETDPITVTGRVLVEARDGGVLLLERNGRIRQLSPASVESRTISDVQYSPMTGDELGTDLLSQVLPGFEIVQTNHYLICSNSSEEYSEFIGKLLERVYDEYFKFMKDLDVPVSDPGFPLPVIVLQSEADFKEFATRQHPETSFENTPGYYSIRENQMLLMDLTRDRSIRSVSAIRKRLSEQPLQVATIVHEAVHQLAFNSGLQVRMADNPVWLSEGLALYFEQVVPRSTSLWTRPGLVNARQHTEFARGTETGSPTISFSTLMQTDKTFLDPSSVATAYAESWAITMYMFRQQKEGMGRFLRTISQRVPLQPVTPDQRILEFTTAFGKSPDDYEQEVVSLIRRLRVPK